MKHFIMSLLSVVCFTLYGQTPKQREEIKSSISKEDSIRSATSVNKYTIQKTKRIEEYLRNHPNTPRSYVKNRKTYELYDISKEGTPIYITTKRIRRRNKTTN